MGNYDFAKDLKVAKESEREIGAYLALRGWKDITYNDDNKYDIKATSPNGTTFRIEVKEDLMCKETGNVALEFDSWNRGGSGITTSEADFYIYKIHTNNGISLVIHTKDDLKKKVENKEYWKVVSGGDKGSNSMNYLFKLDKYLDGGKKQDFSYEEYEKFKSNLKKKSVKIIERYTEISKESGLPRIPYSNTTLKERFIPTSRTPKEVVAF